MTNQGRNDLYATAAAIVAAICLVRHDNAQQERRRREAERREAVHFCLRRATLRPEQAADHDSVTSACRTRTTPTYAGAGTGSAL